MTTLLTPEKSAAVLADLVSLALKQTGRSALSTILRQVAQSVNAYGCVLWEAAPGSNFDADPPQGRLFVLDQWLEDGRVYAFHDLPLHSAVGSAILERKTLNISDIENDSRSQMHPRYLRSLGVKALVSTPVFFPDRRRRGAITVYRKSNGPFEEEEVALIEQLAVLVPLIYQTIRGKLIFSLTRRVDNTLRRTNLRGDDQRPSEEIVKANATKAINQICAAVSDAFNCLETSIFLQDANQRHSDYELIATTWREPISKTIYERNERSMTGWVLTYDRPVRIFDLSSFERERLAIRNQYHGLAWTDSLNIKSAVRRIFHLDPTADLPPLSFMASPIRMGGKVLGVIRCSAAKGGPYYFTEDDLRLLELIAAKIAQYWNHWVNEIETQEENYSWQLFSKSIGELNAFALTKLSYDREPTESEIFVREPTEVEVFAEALRLISSVIKGAESMDIRMLDRMTNELCFVATHGQAWNEGGLQEIQMRKHRRFEVSDSSASAGAYVFQTAKVYHIDSDISDDSFYSAELTFPGVKRMIIAPIRVGAYTYGVLDIRGGGRPFPKNAEAIADLLGQQLGLYHFIAETIDLLRKAQVALQDQVKERIQTVEDLAHQLKSPINQAYSRIQLVLQGKVDSSKLETSLLAIRGLTRRARRVAMSTTLYGALAKGMHIKPKLVALDHASALKLLIESARDNELLIDPSRQISIRVNKESFKVLESNKVEVDHDLLEQALNNILDNAGKYSYPNSVIDIQGGLTARTRRFHISVVNVGLPIKSNEVQHCIVRGWRGDTVKHVTGEGSGIGLWIVDNIMRSHGGELRIVPTTPSGRTEIKLIFPSQT